MSAETDTKKSGLDLLREPFPENQICQLPKPTIPNEQWKRLPKGRCNECGGWHAKESTIHLSYVGHAALTDRLLDADPNWTWEPLALDQKGLPAVDENGGMWIKLTVCGMTRLGYGDSQGKTGPNAVKERIGDALRNAAMRFGAALELWHKGELHVEEDEAPPKQQKSNNGQPPNTDWDGRMKRAIAAVHRIGNDEGGLSLDDWWKGFRTNLGPAPAQWHDPPLRSLADRLNALQADGKLTPEECSAALVVAKEEIREPTDTETQAQERF